MPVCPDDVQQVASLARLEIEASSLDDVTHRFACILSMVQDLSTVDTTGVPPMSNPHDAIQRLRADDISSDNQRDALMSNAPEAADGYFLVPRVVD